MSEGLRRWKPQPATVISLIALFVAIGGTAFAANLAKNSVKSKHIKDGQVKTADVGDGAIGNVDLADGSVSTAKILDATVGTADLADNSVNSAKVAADTLAAADLANNSADTAEIASNAVDSAEIAANAVDGIEINADAVDQGELANDSIDAAEIAEGITGTDGTPVNIGGGAAENGAYEIGTATASCAANEQIIGGTGFWSLDDNASNNLELFIAEVRINYAAESSSSTAATTADRIAP